MDLNLVISLGGVALLAMVLFARTMQDMNRRAAKRYPPVMTIAQNLPHNNSPSGDLGMIAKDIRQLFRQFDSGRLFPADGERTNWTAETLRKIMRSDLAGAEVIVVSNREPYIHNYDKDGDIEVQVPASGLVSALEPVTRACGGVWIAHGCGTADRQVVDKADRIPVPPNVQDYTLRRVWVSDEEMDGYYYGLANEGLWPLCHIAFVRPTFRHGDWEVYQAINERFADAVAAEASSDSPIVLVQDYHFGLLPRMVRERLPNATIITFWHIPWPNSETFGIFPWREEIIRGLLGSSILGFHTKFHCNNFMETAERFIESRVDRERGSIMLGGEETFVRSYPISIEWPPAPLASQAPVPACREAVLARFGMKPKTRLAVGIERFDYTKGILDRMRAVDEFLINYPQWKGKFAFVQVVAPTRSKLSTYQNLQEETERLAQEINDRHCVGDFTPIRLVVRHHEPPEVYELFRAADICLVSSLHDGMNLVAKEFVAARDDERGVLILSCFAGASRELSEALLINPYDPHSMAAAIEQALTMSPAEQEERMKLMRDVVRLRNVYRWAGLMLLDACRLRKKQRVLKIAAKAKRKGGAGRHA